MLFSAPPMPAFPSGQAATTPGYLRYEDVTQDGRLIPLACPSALAGLWRSSLTVHVGHKNAIKTGVLPLLTRMTIETLDQKIRVDKEIATRSGFELSRATDGSRLFMNVWAEIQGSAGRIGPNATAGELAIAGRLFAEHTFTRPFGPPDQRKVTRLNVEGYPEPETVYAQPAPASAQEPPEGGRWLDDLAPDSIDYCFTLDNTDSNQHVNSIAYIRLYIDAAQRRLAAAGHAGKIRSRAVDIAYRKPSFAGDRVRSHVRLFSYEDGVGAAGYIAGDDGKPRCYVRVAFGA
jgi:hypothetical protein